MYDVITIGGATLDVFLHCPEMEHVEIKGKIKIALPHGQKVEVGSALFETGGGATNTATTFSRQGLKTAVLAKVGDDFAGEKVMTQLEKEHVDTSLVVKDPNDTTDFATIIWKNGAGNVLLVARGNGRLESAQIPWDRLSTSWFYLSSIEGNLAVVKELVDKNADVKTAWNPGTLELSQPEMIREVLPSITLLILNRKEASLLTKTSTTEIHSLLSEVSHLPPSMKLITDGHNGSYFHDGKKWTKSAAYQVDRVETTGAGDAYGSAFVSGLIKGLTTEETLKLAAANAASVVMHPGAKAGILTEKQDKEWKDKDLEITNQ